jgi:hypothetical protein
VSAALYGDPDADAATRLRCVIDGRLRWSFRIGSCVFRQFRIGDTDALLTVRNDPSVRTHLQHPEPLEREAHRRWVSQALLPGGHSLVMLAWQADAPVGFVNLKIRSQTTLELGAMFIAGVRPSVIVPYAVAFIGHLAIDRFGAQTVLTSTHPTNRRALRLNRGFGLTEATLPDKPTEVGFLTDAATVRAALARYRHWLAEIEATLTATEA